MTEAKLGPQEPPDDPRIFNRRQPDGTFRPMSEFFEPNKQEHTMTARHTPGPWIAYLEHQTELGYPIAGPNEEEAFIAYVNDQCERAEDCEGNAHLIAGAPKTLEVLRNLLSDVWEWKDVLLTNMTMEDFQKVIAPGMDIITTPTQQPNT